LAYDSRTTQLAITCDHFVGGDATDAVFQTTFASNSLNCSTQADYWGLSYFDGKYVWVPYDSTNQVTLIMGDSGPNYGAWSDLRTFKVRLTREGLKNVLASVYAHRTFSGFSNFANFSQNPSDYQLSALAVLQETVWFDASAIVNMASSFGNLKLNQYIAK
jgi:hypothetical protein